jgi:NAD-dependent dihydropyrimidine dehydrogenase PreA subunit
MAKHSPTRTIVLFLLLIALVVGLSLTSGHFRSGKPEELPEPKQVIINEQMTVGEFGRANDLTNPVLKGVLGLQTRSDLQKKLSEYGTPDQIRSLVKKKLALAAERATKNWIKIQIKFGMWFAFLITLFILMRKRKATPRLRKWLLFISVLIFGIIMGSDPSPMGTVKDAIHLYGSARAVFPPRMIALTLFLLIVFLANKYICAWGCQAGVLQDLIFRLNQTDKRKAILGKQIKPPFLLTNTVRVAFMGIFTAAAFAWGADIIEPVDPFKLYKPAYLGLAGAGFVGILLVASLFVYRPWCHLFCPFGLVGWLVEKVSRVRISVDYETCIACQKCATACPSTVMEAILKRDRKTIPDCFACYTCREVCPTNSISFSARKRRLPPPGHFEKKGRSELVEND